MQLNLKLNFIKLKKKLQYTRRKKKKIELNHKRREEEKEINLKPPQANAYTETKKKKSAHLKRKDILVRRKKKTKKRRKKKFKASLVDFKIVCEYFLGRFKCTKILKFLIQTTLNKTDKTRKIKNFTEKARTSVASIKDIETDSKEYYAIKNSNETKRSMINNLQENTDTLNLTYNIEATHNKFLSLIDQQDQSPKKTPTLNISRWQEKFRTKVIESYHTPKTASTSNFSLNLNPLTKGEKRRNEQIESTVIKKLNLEKGIESARKSSFESNDTPEINKSATMSDQNVNQNSLNGINKQTRITEKTDPI